MSAAPNPAPVPVAVPKNLLGKKPQTGPGPFDEIAQAITDGTLPIGAPAPDPALSHQVDAGSQAMTPIPAPKPAKVKKAKAKMAPAQEPVGPLPHIHHGGTDMTGLAQVQTPGVSLLAKADGATVYNLAIPAPLADRIVKPITGVGGWQRVMHELQGQLTGAPAQDPVSGLPVMLYTLAVTPFLLNRLIGLSVKHGSGGYQAVIRHVVCLALAQFKTAILGGSAAPVATEDLTDGE